MLFLVYINGMPDCLTSNARLFADGCLLYRKIQSDLQNLKEWESKWQMEFNTDKCEVIRITNKQKLQLIPSTTRTF